MEDPRRLVIVASNGGRRDDPSWWMNLKASPDAEVQLKSEKILDTARKATDIEKTIFWPRLTEMYPSYDAYQKKTSREIPVIILETKHS